jgi:L-iditol 2-dehydrogenase
MKALVKRVDGPGGLELMDDWPEPTIKRDEVLIEVAFAGVCGTDLHILKGHWPCRTPVILGHEFCGHIVAVGDDIADLSIGDRVVAGNPAQVCGVCRHCRAGNPFMCKKRVSLGFMIDGAFCRFIGVRRHAVHRIPPDVSMEEAALCEPMAAAVRALTERTTVKAGDCVLVSGAGPIGLLCAAVARAQGGTVIVCGLSADQRRLDCARELGADAVVNLEQDDLRKTLSSFTGDEGVDIAVECAGAPGSLAACLDHVRKGGTLVQLGIYSAPFMVDFSRIVMHELQVIGVYGHVWETWERTLALMQNKKVNVKPLITHKLPITRWNEGLDAIHRGEAIKVLFEPV